MGQQEIQKILEKESNDYVSTIKIASILDQSTSLIIRALNKMFKYREVSKKILRGTHYWKLKKYSQIKPNLVIAK